MAGRRTSVYLSEDLAAAVDASGVPLAEIVRRGLADPLPGPAARMLLRPSPPPRVSAANCPHRGLSPGAWCKACQSVVPERRK
jgi:hypothetical protein